MEKFVDSVKDKAYGHNADYFASDNVLYFFGNEKRSVEIHSTDNVKGGHYGFEVNYFDVDADGNGTNERSDSWPFKGAPEPALAYAYLREAYREWI